MTSKTIMMDILKRNFFNLLKKHEFDENVTIEPMSAYKWGIMKGICNSHGFSLNVTNDGSGCNTELHYAANIPDAGLSHLKNPMLNKRLMRIRDNEPLDADASIETLNMLDIIVQVTERLLTKGMDFAYIVNMGTFLRTHGDKIDYVKLEGWLHKLHIGTMAELEGNVLIYTCGFEKDEIPFVYKIQPSAYKMALNSLMNHMRTDASEWQFRQNGNIFATNDSKAMFATIRNILGYLQFAPIETTCVLFNEFVKSISNLEE